MKLIMQIKRLVAFVLVLTLIFPSVALAGDMNLMGYMNSDYGQQMQLSQYDYENSPC